MRCRRIPWPERLRDTEGSAQVALRLSFGRSPSSGMGLANRCDWTRRRLSSYLNPRLSARRGRIGMRFWWIRGLMPPRTPLPVLTPCAVEPRSMFRPTRAIQICVFKDGHPYLVGLPSPVPSRISTVSRRFHPVALTQAGALTSTEPVTRRHVRPEAPVPVTPEESPRIFAAAVW
jgi:hypothetical protein